MKKKLIVSLVSSFVAVALIAVCVIIATKSYQAKFDGRITIEVIDLDGKQIEKEKIWFEEGDTLISLVEENFDNVLIENGMIMNIEDYVTPADWSTFLSIYVDDQMSMVGISDIEFKDGTVISFRITEYIPI